MYKTREKTKFMVLVTMLCSLQVVLMVTPLGFIPIGPINATTLHIPVIVSGILLGVKAGAILGFVFGMGSLIRATFLPGITSFLFSPFAPPIGGYQGNFFSLVIALVPRILLGVLSAWIYKFFKDKNYKLSGSAITALFCTLLHTILVLGLIYVFFGSAYANALDINPSYLIPFLLGLIYTNGLIEAILAVFVVSALVKALEPMVKKMIGSQTLNQNTVQLHNQVYELENYRGINHQGN